MSQLTKFASLAVLSTALSAAGCMAETTESSTTTDDMTVQIDEAKQGSLAGEMDTADQSAAATMDSTSTTTVDEEGVGETADASRVWGWGGWHRPWGWGGWHRPWGWGGWHRPWGWGGWHRPWGWWGGWHRPFWGGWGGCGWGGCW